MSFLEHTPNRRQFIRGIAASSLFMVGCERSQIPTSSTDSQPAGTPPLREQYLEAIDKIKDPIYRAASILGSNSHGLWHAGLFGNYAEFYFLTQWHNIDSNEPRDTEFVIPGVGTFTEKKARWVSISEHPLDNDPNIKCYVGSDLAREIREKIKAKEITPLERVIPGSTTSFRVATAMADEGTMAEATFKEFDAPSQLIRFLIDKGRICKGFSGQPALVIENNVVTNKSCGLVTKATVQRADEGCTRTQFFVRSHG